MGDSATGRRVSAVSVPMSNVLLLSGPVQAGPDLGRYLLVCFGLLCLILGLAWVFRRFLAHHLTRRAAQRSLQVLDVLPLGGKQKLVVVRCYDRSFLSGWARRR